MSSHSLVFHPTSFLRKLPLLMLSRGAACELVGIKCYEAAYSSAMNLSPGPFLHQIQLYIYVKTMFMCQKNLQANAEFFAPRIYEKSQASRTIKIFHGVTHLKKKRRAKGEPRGEDG